MILLDFFLLFLSFISLCVVAVVVVDVCSFIRVDDVDDDSAASDNVVFFVVAVAVFYFFVGRRRLYSNVFCITGVTFENDAVFSFLFIYFAYVFLVRFLFYISVVGDSIESKNEITVVMCVCFFFPSFAHVLHLGHLHFDVHREIKSGYLAEKKGREIESE